MNIIKFLRKPYLATLLASLMIFASCSQYDNINDIEEMAIQQKHNFNYDAYNEFIKSSNTIDFKVLKNKRATNIENEKAFVNAINNKYGTNVKTNKSLMEMVNYTPKEIQQQSLENGWVTKDYIDIMNNFAVNLESNNFNIALKTMENDILNLELTKEEFSKYNRFVNSIKVIQYQNPDTFSYRKDWRCILATISMAGAASGLAAACGTPVVVAVGPCAAASVLYAAALAHLIDACNLAGQE